MNGDDTCKQKSIAWPANTFSKGEEEIQEQRVTGFKNFLNQNYFDKITVNACFE